MDLIRRNFGLKVASLLIAIGLWFMFNYLSSSQAFSTTLEVPLTLHGVGGGLVARSAVDTVKVELAGPRAVLEQLEPSDFAAFVDCTGKQPGVESLDVTVVGPERDKVRAVSPSTAIVSIDRFAYRSVPVISSGGEDLIATDIQPRSVMVSGGETILARVMAVRVSLEGASTSKPVVVMLKPTPVDADFAPVSGAVVAPPTVRVAIAPKARG
jgi:YbbR domain-containing protein